MQNTGTLSAHQNVTEKENYAKRVFDSIPTYISTRWQQQKEELLNSESDTSTTLRNNRCRRKTFAVYSTCILLLVLSCLVNVIGALDSSSSSLSNVNYYDNSTNYTRTLLDEIDDIPLLSTYLDDINDIENLTLIAGARRQPIYQNEFAVHILGGIEKANEVAKKYGFTNMGQKFLWSSRPSHEEAKVRQFEYERLCETRHILIGPRRGQTYRTNTNTDKDKG